MLRAKPSTRAPCAATYFESGAQHTHRHAQRTRTCAVRLADGVSRRAARLEGARRLSSSSSPGGAISSAEHRRRTWGSKLSRGTLSRPGCVCMRQARAHTRGQVGVSSEGASHARVQAQAGGRCGGRWLAGLGGHAPPAVPEPRPLQGKSYTPHQICLHHQNTEHEGYLDRSCGHHETSGFKRTSGVAAFNSLAQPAALTCPASSLHLPCSASGPHLFSQRP